MQKKILNYIQQNPTAYQAEIATVLQTSRTMVSRVLRNNNVTVPHKSTKTFKCSDCGAPISKDNKSLLCKTCLKESKRTVATCDVCGTAFIALKSQYKRTKMHFCGLKCRGWWLGKHHKRKGMEHVGFIENYNPNLNINELFSE